MKASLYFILLLVLVLLFNYRQNTPNSKIEQKSQEFCQSF